MHILVPACAGEIPPGGVAVLNWRFHPLESREYSVGLGLTLGGSGGGRSVERKVLTITGKGYHPQEQVPSRVLSAMEKDRWVAGCQKGQIVTMVLTCAWGVNV